MKRLQNTYAPLVKILGLLLMMITAAGCDLEDALTALNASNNDASRELWNPQPGDEIVPGREVPLLEDGYWESNWGMEINPQWLPSANVTIGPDGGTLRLGPYEITIPAGVVSEPVQFSTAVASLTGIAVDCGPSPFQFGAPITLALSYIGTQYENSDSAAQLQIMYMAEDGSFVPLSSSVDLQEQTISAQLDHFSRYIVG